MGREENIAVFQDTEHRCKSNQRLKEGIVKSVQAQRLILESDGVERERAFAGQAVQRNHYEKAARVVVSKKRSYEAAGAYQGKRVCVHNFASASNPDGGVTKGDVEWLLWTTQGGTELKKENVSKRTVHVADLSAIRAK